MRRLTDEQQAKLDALAVALAERTQTPVSWAYHALVPLLRPGLEARWTPPTPSRDWPDRR